MQTQARASFKPTAAKAEFEKENTHEIGKTVIIVNSVFRKDGLNINNILSRLIKADVEESFIEN